MALKPRFLTADLNLVKAIATVLSADSFQQGNPVRFLLDQLRSKPWRSDMGWVVVAGWNDKIDFNTSGSDLAATIAPGTYATGADYGAAAAAAMVAAAGGGTVTFTYGANGKFTVHASFVFTFLFATGVNAATSARIDLGFNAADVGNGSGDIVADNAVYQSRHYIACDFGSALAITAAVLQDDNVSASGSVSVQSSATSILAALTAPAATQALTDEGTYWKKYFASQSHRYVVLLINDVGNSLGYAEAGIAFLGTYQTEMSVIYSINFEEEGDDLSVVTRATEGANLGDQRAEAQAWGLEWLEVPAADADILRTIRSATLKGKNFFFDFDANTSGQLVYGFRDSPLAIRAAAAGLYWTGAFTFRKALP